MLQSTVRRSTGRLAGVVQGLTLLHGLQSNSSTHLDLTTLAERVSTTPLCRGDFNLTMNHWLAPSVYPISSEQNAYLAGHVSS
jgi:hypothetical protein